MKRFTAILASILMVAALATPAFATFDQDEGSIGGGLLGVKAKAGGLNGDAVFRSGDGAFVAGGAIAGGIGKAKAGGIVFNGTGYAEVFAIGGGAVEVDTYGRRAPNGLLVGTSSKTIAAGGAGVKVGADGASYPAFVLVGGKAFAVVGQGSFSASGLETTGAFRSEGETGGIAAQGSIGGLKAGALAVSGPDTYRYVGTVWANPRLDRPVFVPAGQDPPRGELWRPIRDVYRPVDSKAAAGAGGTIFMEGVTYSESYRVILTEAGTRTEVLGTNVGAETLVTSDSFQFGADRGCAFGGSCLRGGYIAGGIAAAKTTQEGVNGGAQAKAFGLYVGGGTVGSNYHGAANGYTRTSVTTFNGMNGSINSAQAGMQVTSAGSGFQGRPD